LFLALGGKSVPIGTTCEYCQRDFEPNITPQSEIDRKDCLTLLLYASDAIKPSMTCIYQQTSLLAALKLNPSTFQILVYLLGDMGL